MACNCDAKIPELLSDEGKITNKDLLPITEFAYGPLEYDARQASIEIGNLRCSGTSRARQRMMSCGTGNMLENELLGEAEIIQDSCGDAELMSSNRLRIKLDYEDYKDCRTVLKLPKEAKMKLSISDFEVRFSVPTKYFRYIFETNNVD